MCDIPPIAGERNTVAARQHQATAHATPLVPPPVETTTNQGYRRSLRPARVLLLRPPDDTAPRYTWLVEQLLGQGLAVTIEINSNPIVSISPDFALVVLCVTAEMRPSIGSALLRLRTYNHSLVVLLADGSEPDWVLEMLMRGADAVYSFTTDEALILARCLTMLRRWQSTSVRQVRAGST